MFNKQELAEARNNLYVKDCIIADLRADKENMKEYISRLEEDLDRLNSLLTDTPNNCKRGRWCEACEFGKTYPVLSKHGMVLRSITYCGRAEACKNFVAKGANKDGTR